MLRVLEFGTYLAAPLLGLHLQHAGYLVTVVRPPSTGRSRCDEERLGETCVAQLQRGKTVRVLDLPDNDDELCKLLCEHDIVLNNFSSEASKRRGFDAERCLVINPKLIVVVLPGFARGDAEYAEYKAFDSIVMAASGVFSSMGVNRALLGIEASFSSLPLPSVYASIFGYFALLCTLYNDDTGVVIEVPLASALSECLVHNSLDFPLDSVYMSRRIRALRERRTAAAITREELDALCDPFFRKYTCACRRTIYLVCPAHATHQLRCLRALGVEDEVMQTLRRVDVYQTMFEHGIGSGNLSAEQSALITPVLARVFMTDSAVAWERVMTAAGVPLVMHRTMNEWKRMPHVAASGLIANDGTLCPVGWLREPTPVVSSSSALPSNLRGIRVLDCTNVIAGPTACAMLARMGAEVIKIDAPQPSYAPEISCVYGIAANVNKRSILLDYHHAEGRAILEELIRHADVLCMNCTTESLVRARLTRRDLHAINPNMVLLHFDAYGGPQESGELANAVGYDDNVQAISGIMARFGGADETNMDSCEEHAHVGTIDVIAGVAAAATTVRALLHRKRDGLVYTARASLCSVGQYLQFPHLHQAPRLEESGRGVACRGEHALHRCYRCRDRWIVLVASHDPHDTNAWKRLKRVLLDAGNTYDDAERACMEDDAEEFTQDSVQTRVAFHETSKLVPRLNRAGIAAAALQTLSELRERHLLDSDHDDRSVRHKTFQFLKQAAHPVGELKIVAPVAIRITSSSLREDGTDVGIPLVLPFAPKYGEHTALILRALIAKMAHSSIGTRIRSSWSSSIAVAHAWSKSYIPFTSPCDSCHKRGKHLLILRCTHRLCAECNKASAHICIVCGCVEDETERQTMRHLVGDWRGGYRAWRRGSAHGARDMEALFRRKTFCVQSVTPQTPRSGLPSQQSSQQRARQRTTHRRARSAPPFL